MFGDWPAPRPAGEQFSFNFPRDCDRMEVVGTVVDLATCAGSRWCSNFRAKSPKYREMGTNPIHRFPVGGELGSTGQLNGKWRVVVGQRAT